MMPHWAEWTSPWLVVSQVRDSLFWIRKRNYLDDVKVNWFYNVYLHNKKGEFEDRSWTIWPRDQKNHVLMREFSFFIIFHVSKSLCLPALTLDLMHIEIGGVKFMIKSWIKLLVRRYERKSFSSEISNLIRLLLSNDWKVTSRTLHAIDISTLRLNEVLFKC
jgi:hypothetical protein